MEVEHNSDPENLIQINKNTYHHGYTLTGIGREAGLHYATVSCIISWRSWR